MITLNDVKSAYLTDVKTKPYFLRDLESPNDQFIYNIGYELLYDCSILIQNKILKPKQIELLYEKIWERLDTLLEIKTQYFQLYFDYLEQLLQFYLDLAEKAELYEVAENLKNLKLRFQKDQQP